MTRPPPRPQKTPQLNPFFHDYHFIESNENISIHPNKQLAHLVQMALPPYGNKFKKATIKIGNVS